MTRRNKWVVGLLAAALLCLMGGFGPLPTDDSRTDEAYLQWRQEPAPERQAAWIAAEAAASRREAAIRQAFVQMASALALAGGLVWWVGERWAARRRPKRDARFRSGRP